MNIHKVESYAIAVLVVLILLNIGISFSANKALAQKFGIFSVGFVMGMTAILIKILFLK
jgi:hypothetical protein